MPLSFTIALVAVITALIGAHFVLLGRAPLAANRPITALNLVLVTIGTVGLILHCGAMFYRNLINAIPGSGGYVHTVNDLGLGSVILYIVPAAVLVFGLRWQYPPAVILLIMALVAVGITMYDHGPLGAHLTAIFISSTLIAGTLTLLVRRSRMPAKNVPMRAASKASYR